MNTSIVLGDLVSNYSNSAPTILNQESIDYCCGGQRTLIEAVGNDQNRAQEILDKIQQAHQHWMNVMTTTAVNFNEMPTPDLVNYIIENHHTFLRNHAPKVAELLLKIYTVHTGKLVAASDEHISSDTRQAIQLLEDMYRLFMKLSTELLIHLVKEEKEIFPYIIRHAQEGQSNAHLATYMESLLKEHNEAGDAVKELADMRKSLPTYCKTVELTKKMLVEFEENLYMHVHLENNVLFKRLLK